MDAKKIAEKIKEEDRQQATIDYFNKATANQKEAAEQIINLVDNSSNVFGDILKASSKNEDYEKIISTVNEVNKLLSQAKNGGDINEIIKNLEALK